MEPRVRLARVDQQGERLDRLRVGTPKRVERAGQALAPRTHQFLQMQMVPTIRHKQTAMLHGAVHGGRKLRVGERLFDEVEGAVAQAFDGCLLGRIAGNDHFDRPGGFFLEFAEQIDAGAVVVQV